MSQSIIITLWPVYQNLSWPIECTTVLQQAYFVTKSYIICYINLYNLYNFTEIAFNLNYFKYPILNYFFPMNAYPKREIECKRFEDLLNVLQPQVISHTQFSSSFHSFIFYYYSFLLIFMSVSSNRVPLATVVSLVLKVDQAPRQVFQIHDSPFMY